MSFLPVACVAAWHYRPVWLEVLPAVAVDHYVLDAQADGTFRAALRMSADALGYTWTVSMKGLKDGEPLLTADGKEQLTFSLGNSSAEQTFEGAWANVKTWSTESSNLYVAHMELKDRDGNVVQTREERVGFRTVEFFPQDGLYLNGTRLVVKGVNRHSFSVDGGRTTSADMSRQDALLIKDEGLHLDLMFDFRN